MERINNPTATENKRFTEGNPAQGLPSTVVDAEWLNAVQEEIMAVLEAAEIMPSGADLTQLAAAIVVIARKTSHVEYALTDHTHLVEQISDLLTDHHEWGKGQRYAQTTLTINAGTVIWDMEANPHAVLVLTSNVTSFSFTNYKAGATYELTILQDATGGRMCAWPAAVRWPGGEALDVTKDANAEDVINVTVRDNSGTPVLRAFAGQDFRTVS